MLAALYIPTKITMRRTHTCGELRATHVGATVTLCGWVDTIRDKGKIIWLDLRDRYGYTQLVATLATTSIALLATLRNLGREYVIEVQGKVQARQKPNPNLATGAIEIIPQHITILNKAKQPPFTIKDKTDGGDALRMRYRYLDLRRPILQKNLQLRHQVLQHTRSYLTKRDFLEIETPLLIRATPEGARDFIVPSRLQHGHGYALPQSPQLLKQLLMISGVDRYFQIARCFRDEDLRADRQPEFTQIDCELSFVNQEDILNCFEGLIIHLVVTINNLELNPFPRMTYAHAMATYGTDKPDLRWGMPIVDLTDVCQGFTTGPLQNVDWAGGILVKEGAVYTRKQIDACNTFVRQPTIGGRGIIAIRYEGPDQVRSSIQKHAQKRQILVWLAKANARPGDLLLVATGQQLPTQKVLGALRLHIAQQGFLKPVQTLAPVWITDFPLLAWDTATQRYQANHHPFTAPHPDDLHLLDEDPAQVRSQAYDMVINGMEIGGGSIRIATCDQQKKILKHIGLTAQEMEAQFGFFLEALTYGAPPHGGIALGLARLCSLLAGQSSIRPFIAFPKNNAGKDVMLKSPALLTASHYHTLGLQYKPI